MRIAILDNDLPEWLSSDGKGILTKVTAKVAILAASPDGTHHIGTRIFQGSVSEYIQGNSNSRVQVEIHLIELKASNKALVTQGLAVLKPDLLLIDCSIDDSDASEGGVDFAEDVTRTNSGIANDDQIIIVTNKKNTKSIDNHNIVKFRNRFLAALKDDTESLASLVVQRLVIPSRRTIDVSNAVNRAVHKAGEPIHGFFHAKPKTKQSLLDACDQLITSSNTLEEAMWLKAAIGHFASTQANNEVRTTNYLNSYVMDSALRLVMTKKWSNEELIRLLGKGAALPNEKLGDFLFPRIDCREGTLFKHYSESQCNEFGFSIDWSRSMPDGVLVGPDYAPNIEAGVPLSWFFSFNREWLGDLGKCLTNSGADKALCASCGGTSGPHHRFVMFWNGSLGFPNKEKLMQCAGKMLLEASKYSHVFIASDCGDGGTGTKVLVEVMPDGRPRDVPSCRMHFGQTLFDFSRWAKGSAYLFVVPGFRN